MKLELLSGSASAKIWPLLTDASEGIQRPSKLSLVEANIVALSAISKEELLQSLGTAEIGELNGK